MDKETQQSLQASVANYKKSRNFSKVPSLRERLNSTRGELRNLVDNLNRNNRLNQSFKDVIKPPMIDHCRIAHWRNNILVIAVDSGQWANKLRFEKINLLSKLRINGFPSISTIEIIVQPDDFKAS